MIWFYDDSIELDDLGHFSWHIWKKKLVPHVFLEVSCCSIIFFLQMLQISKILNKLLYKHGNTEHKAYKLAIKQKHKPTIITFPHSLCERVIFLVVVTKTATYTQFTIRFILDFTATWLLKTIFVVHSYIMPMNVALGSTGSRMKKQNISIFLWISENTLPGCEQHFYMVHALSSYIMSCFFLTRELILIAIRWKQNVVGKNIWIVFYAIPIPHTKNGCWRQYI